MTRSGTQDASQRRPRPSNEARGLASSRLAWAAFLLWIAYSAALLGWHALDAPPADACIVR
ncbi:MAG: hypothetical protein LPJ94_12735 [Thauera sp.]|uniref:hypothetical protein n=1 Tax=Thauera sp. JM12B12 TaxID=3142262 RepID=UPI0029C331D2|nr:hypothetical protein [Thauera sp.]